MTDTFTPPQFIPILHAAKLYGVDSNAINRKVVHGELDTIMWAGRPVILWASLPKDKQDAYPALLETMTTKRRAKK